MGSWAPLGFASSCCSDVQSNTGILVPFAIEMQSIRSWTSPKSAINVIQYGYDKGLGVLVEEGTDLEDCGMRLASVRQRRALARLRAVSKDQGCSANAVLLNSPSRKVSQEWRSSAPMIAGATKTQRLVSIGPHA